LAAAPACARSIPFIKGIAPAITAEDFRNDRREPSAGFMVGITCQVEEQDILPAAFGEEQGERKAKRTPTKTKATKQAAQTHSQTADRKGPARTLRAGRGAFVLAIGAVGSRFEILKETSE